MKKSFIILLVVFLAFSLLGSTRSNLVGKQYKEIKAAGWFNTTSLKIANLKGKVVVLEFWATWCPPCRRSIPHLIKLYKQYKDKGVVFISLTSESKSRLDRFFSSRPDLKMPYPVGYGSYTARSYGVRGIPHAFVINKQGIISWSGHPMTSSFKRAIKKSLNKSDVKIDNRGGSNKGGDNTREQEKDGDGDRESD